MSDSKHYVIVHAQYAGCYWSETRGWGELAYATLFTDDDYALQLPGLWVEINDIPELLFARILSAVTLGGLDRSAIVESSGLSRMEIDGACELAIELRESFDEKIEKAANPDRYRADVRRIRELIYSARGVQEWSVVRETRGIQTRTVELQSAAGLTAAAITSQDGIDINFSDGGGITLMFGDRPERESPAKASESIDDEE